MGAPNGGAFVEIPFDVEQAFGRKRVPVRATIGGEPYRGSLVRMGTECHILGIRMDIRAKIGRDVGDEVDVVLEEDTDERVVDVPDDLSTALAQHADAAALFERLSYSHRREYVQWITEAKRDATRMARIDRTVAMLKAGKKDPR